jgi:chorismate-pyruvate lyase
MFAVALALASTTPEQFRAGLIASPSATAILQRQCGTRGSIVAVKQPVRPRKVPKRLARALRLAPSEAVTYRRVRLTCDGVAFSEAENWFVPARLPPDMAAQLASGDTPFGRVVQPLRPSRQTLSATARWHKGYVPERFLRVEAIVSSGAGIPLSAVIETYRRAALSGSE